MKRSRRKFSSRFGLTLSIVVLIAAAILARPLLATQDKTPLSDNANLAMIRGAMSKIAPLHRKKTPPGEKDWLANHKEVGQTFDEYLKSNPNRPTASRQTIYILPLGDFDKTQSKLVDDTEDFLGRFFMLPIKRLDSVTLDVIPAKARRVHPQWGGNQILTTYVLNDLLKKRASDDAVATIALTATDLWPGAGWNFVFGQASLDGRVGVWSFSRFGDPADPKEYPLVLSRTIKTAAHETCHMLGIQHCTAYECIMNGANHLEEADNSPLALCPEDVAKIWWTCGLSDPVKRYKSLADFAEAHELKDAADFWRKSEKLVASPSSKP